MKTALLSLGICLLVSFLFLVGAFFFYKNNTPPSLPCGFEGCDWGGPISCDPRMIKPMGAERYARYCNGGKPLPPPPPAPSSTTEINPPVISNLSASAATSSVTVSWTTNKLATTKLLFGSSTAMWANVPVDATLSASHSIRVSYLSPGTTYYYEAQSTDASGKIGSSAQQSFTTASAATSTGL